MKNNSYISTDRIDRKWIDINIPCKTACPIMTNIPEYIDAIMKGNYEKAYEINRRDNVIPSILGRICTRPCEDACRHGRNDFGDSVAICFLKRSASDYGMKDEDQEDNYTNKLKSSIKSINKKIAIVGAGPAGLTAANDLALKGYDVTIYEQFKEAGGMLRYGIPQFRLPYDIVKKDVDSIKNLGVKINYNIRFDNTDQIEDIKKTNDAIIIAGGCLMPTKVDFEGIDQKGFYWGLDFMKKCNEEDFNEKMNKVLVIGGGFTSVDCARMALSIWC